MILALDYGYSEVLQVIMYHVSRIMRAGGRAGKAGKAGRAGKLTRYGINTVYHIISYKRIGKDRACDSGGFFFCTCICAGLWTTTLLLPYTEWIVQRAGLGVGEVGHMCRVRYGS